MRHSRLPYPAELPGAAQASGGSSAAPGTPAYNPTWYTLTDIYLDPVNGSDSRAGNSPSTAIKTMSEVIRRYGSWTPQLVYGSNPSTSSLLTIHQLTTQSPGVDAFFFDPRQSGNANVLWDALSYCPKVGAAFSPTSVNAKMQSAAGNDLQLVGNLPAGIVAGQLVYNVTRAAWSVVKSVTGSGAGQTATLLQPITAASLFSSGTTPAISQSIVPVEDDGWVAGNSYQLYQPLLCNWKDPRPVGGDSNDTSTSGVIWVQGVHIPDASGNPIASNQTISPAGCSMSFVLCTFDPFLLVDGEASLGVSFVSCMLNGSGFFDNNYFFYGCYIPEPECGQGGIQCDTIVDILITQGFGLCILSTAHITTALTLSNGSRVSLAGAGVQSNETGVVWGASTCNVTGGAEMINNTDGLWANFLKLATLQLDGATTGSSFNAAAAGNPYTAGITITSAALDTGGGASNPGLQNPRTGSRYAST